ncbi:MAG: hypothetical protein KDJ47_02705 [Hyphomicrobiaceae bacterium]|nr:hypothetical protein [Hyphomicrobiaceae bacterium]
MLFQLLASFMMGVLAASLAYIAYRISGRRLSRAIIPFAAALGMLGFSAWNEMTWYSRTAAAMSSRLVIIEQGKPVSNPLSPWTYLYPTIDSFRLLDTESLQPLPGNPGMMLAQVHTVTRFLPTTKSAWVLDCTHSQLAHIGPQTKFGEQGMPVNLTWGKVGAGNTITTAACAPPSNPAPGAPSGN